MNTDTGRKWAALLILAIMFVAACDPGMTIRQRNGKVAPSDPQNASQNDLDVRVREERPLIGTKYYIPQIVLTNHLKVPVKITRLELVTGEHSYEPTRKDYKNLQPVIPVNASVSLSPWYDLDNPVYKAFAKNAELKVFYESGGQEQVHSVQLEGIRPDE